MASSQLAKELRKIRIDFEINRPKMAKDLKITDRELSNIEAGKSEVTYSFMHAVATKYSRSENEFNSCLERLRDAHIDSICSVSFDMSNFTPAQKMRVIALRDSIAEENKAIDAQKEIEKKRVREERAAAKAAKKAVVSDDTETLATTTPSDLGVVEEVVEKKVAEKAPEALAKVESSDSGLSDDDLSVLEALSVDDDFDLSDLAA